MKKTIYLFIFTFLPLFLYTQTDNYSIYVSFYNKRVSKKYTVNLLNDDSIYTLTPDNYYRFHYKKNNLTLIVKKNGNLIFEMDSIEKYYTYNNNTVYIDIQINKKANKNSVSGLFIQTDYITENDFFCTNCIEDKNHIVTIGSSKGEYEFMHYNFIQRVLIFLHLKKEYY